MTPRRSSRARTTQPSPALLQHTNSSSSGNSLTRGERSTRSHHKISSPQRSLAQRSQSLDDSDSKVDFPQTRQRHREPDESNEDLPQTAVDDGDDEGNEEEEEEVTRCLCGQQEYPGLPPSRRNALGRLGQKAGGKDDSTTTLAMDASDHLTDDLGSMFIQCDSCKVWQHGGCVGIMDEAMSPDEYFCEECRKDLHKVVAESNGRYSSQYLPVAATSSPGSSSRESSRDNSQLSRDLKAQQIESTKRRSTMNSRDAAYDEEEFLRRAIEESKEDTRLSHDDAASRRTKRSRSDSEVNKQVAKRQRTSSPSPSALSKQSNSVSQPASDDESKSRANSVKKQRVTQPRNPRDKDTKDPEEPETEQPDTAGRRKSRSERRRGEDSENEGEVSPTKLATAAVVNDPEPSDRTPGTPVQSTEQSATRPSTRKSGRPPARRGGRLGRNQYTRDRDHVNGEGNNSPNSPHGGYRDQARDSPHGSGHGGGPNGVQTNGADTGKAAAKTRHLNPHRTSMNEMKRRVAAILDFISRMQVEMAVSGESNTPPDGNGTGNGSRASLVKEVQEQLGALLQATNNDSATSTTDSSTVSVTDGEGPSSSAKEKDFKELSSVEMMDVLTRHLLKWQQEYGKYGEK